MRLSALILALGSTLSLLCVDANATTSPRGTAVVHEASAHPAVAKHGSSASPHRAYVAPFPSSPIVTPRYIYVPANAANPPVVSDTCQNVANNCTNQQLCEIWGQNCPTYA
jgi:hypothetical protein